MIIKTKYRDIPFEQALQCFTDEPIITSQREKWEQHRGKEVAIHVPAVAEHQWKYFKCEGPHFARVGDPKSGVCPHIAEIGD